MDTPRVLKSGPSIVIAVMVMMVAIVVIPLIRPHISKRYAYVDSYLIVCHTTCDGLNCRGYQVFASRTIHMLVVVVVLNSALFMDKDERQ
jgi:hypothetical protein